MSDELQKKLAELALKLGTTADHLWRVLIAQAPLSSTVYFAYLAAVAAGAVAIWKLGMKHSNKPIWYGSKIAAAIMFLVALVMLGDLSTALAGFFNPEYWALQDLITLIKGD
jgi:hypothetical protein